MKNALTLFAAALFSLLNAAAFAAAPVAYRCHKVNAPDAEVSHIEFALSLDEAIDEDTPPRLTITELRQSAKPGSVALGGYYRLYDESQPPLDYLKNPALEELKLQEWDLDEVVIAHAAESQNAAASFWLHSVRTKNTQTGILEFSGAYGGYEGQNFLCPRVAVPSGDNLSPAIGVVERGDEF